MKTLATRTALAVLAALLMLAGVACAPTPSDGPGPTAALFAQALEGHDLEAAANLTTLPAIARPALAAAFDGLQAEGVDLKIGQVRTTGDTSVVDYEYIWTLPKDSNGAERDWRYQGTFHVLRTGSVWQIRWDPTVLNPGLGANQQMVLRSVPAPRAPVNSASGGTVLEPGTVTRIELDAAKVPQNVGVLEVATQLTQALAPLNPKLDPVHITDQATSMSEPYIVDSVNQKDLDKLPGDLSTLPGVTLAEQADLVPTDPTFAPALLSSIKKEVQGRIKGTDGWAVIARADTGALVRVLTRVAPQAKPAIEISISPRAQSAAQAAVNTRVDLETMMVVIQPSTGDVLAVAQNPVADKQGALATSGLYPPGSTGKIITANAVLQAGVATPGTTVPCPGTLAIGERVVPNYNEFSLGPITMQRAFAQSCNTSFAFLGAKLASDALHRSAAELGVGIKYGIDGLPVATGQYPVTDNLTQQVENSFGQGTVLVTPFAMALVCATVARGHTVTPRLLLDRDTEVTGNRPPLDPKAIAGLRSMMREVVETGTASLLEGSGDVLGKTGEAEVTGGSHAWFVGYRGDLAFATMIVLGGSSDNAVRVTKAFFDRYDAPGPSIG